MKTSLALRPDVRRLHQVLHIAVASICFTGCAGRTLPPTDLIPVEGTVLFEGKPAAGVIVTLVPDGSGKASAGKTNVDGKFRLATLQGLDGAATGKYKVVIAGRHRQEYAPSSGETSPASTDLPTRYAMPTTTPLTLEVPTTGPTLFQLTRR